MARILILTAFLSIAATAETATLYLIPNTHGTVSGWLVDFDVERNYVLNNYLAHMDRVRSDQNYRFAYSEVPNLISFLQFARERLPELKQLHAQKRLEFSNGFFLEPDINLSGGEALVEMGVLGLQWYQEVFGFRPRHCWMIDITGAHRQFPQIVTGLGMDSVFFNRNNPTTSPVFWWVAPDGTRAMALANKHYGEFGGPKGLFGVKDPLPDEQFVAMHKVIQAKLQASPSKTSLFSLAGFADYSLPPLRTAYPSEFLGEWNRRYPDIKIRFSIPSDYVDVLNNEIKSGQTRLPEYSGDTGYSWDSFWLNMPEVRQSYRKDEHLLQAAEALATAASLRGRLPYPSQDFYHSWINMLMNMDRNTIWGASAGMVFKDARHWDAWDRFESVERQARSTLDASARAMTGAGQGVALYSALNWKRDDPVQLELPAGQTLDGVPCESLVGAPGRAICRPPLPSAGIASFRLKAGPAPAAAPASLPDVIETPYYQARIDAASGALISLKVRPSGEELLGGAANVIVADTVAGMKVSAEHFMHPKPKRRLLATSADFPAAVRVLRGPLTTQIVVNSDFYKGSKIERGIVFHRDHPRIDFETRLDLNADDVLIGVDFPLSADVVERSRGIPYGFSSVDPRAGAGFGILPSIRWSNCQLSSGAGLALLDRGLTGHELTGRILTLGLVNAVSTYMKRPNEMLRGQGVRTFSYALVPHAGPWRKANVVRMAWEFNALPVTVSGTREGRSQSFLDTSSNVIVEAVRRVGRQIEVRLVETSGESGTAELTVRLPHKGAALTNMMGEKPQPLSGGPAYRFPIRPQQIVTIRLNTNSRVAVPVAIRDWTPLVPPEKRKGLELRFVTPGHPGSGHPGGV